MHEKLLPFPLKARERRGKQSEEYLIPDTDREAVLNLMYPFEGVPGLDDRRIDIHVDREFRVGDFKVVREDGMNYLVSPYYYDGGGTVADWFHVEEGEDA